MKRKNLTTGPEINTQEEAMKTLGIEKEFPGSEDSGVSIKVDLFFTNKIIISVFANATKSQLVYCVIYMCSKVTAYVNNSVDNCGAGILLRNKETSTTMAMHRRL